MAYPKTLFLGGNPDNVALVFESQEQETATLASGFFDGFSEAKGDDEPVTDDPPKRGRGRPRKQVQ
jgi:hypothetical protein